MKPFILFSQNFKFCFSPYDQSVSKTVDISCTYMPFFPLAMGAGAAEVLSRTIEEEKEKALQYLETLKRKMAEANVSYVFLQLFENVTGTCM